MSQFSYLRVTRQLIAVAKDLAYHEKYLRLETHLDDIVSNRIAVAACKAKIHALAGALSEMYQYGSLSAFDFDARDAAADEVVVACKEKLKP